MIPDTITDTDRYPTLTEAGRRMLQFLREHPHAPIYRNESGNRLTADEVSALRGFEAEMGAARLPGPSQVPDWRGEFVARCLAEVPFYRQYGSAPAMFEELPTISRADLSRDIARFVPDSLDIRRLIHFRTSGTTGHPLLLPSHPVVAGRYLAFHRRALRRFGIELRHGRGQVGVVLMGFQRRCFTYVSVTPTLEESGLAKINLHPNDWRDPADRARYLDDLAAEIWTGDPISFAELLELPLQARPRAMLSTSMTLLPGLRRRLEERFDCPVLDVYSLNEAGPVAVRDDHAGGHVLLQARLWVEILDERDQPVPPGERGEVTLTGGFNFCLPLLRYRTGDFAGLSWAGPEPVLTGLEGRPTVRFRTAGGEWLNNIEVTHALQSFALSQFTLQQAGDGSLRLRVAGFTPDLGAAQAALRRLFGPELPLVVESVPSFDGKVVQYTSEL